MILPHGPLTRGSLFRPDMRDWNVAQQSVIMSAVSHLMSPGNSLGCVDFVVAGFLPLQSGTLALTESSYCFTDWLILGSVAEWFKALVLKTSEG